MNSSIIHIQFYIALLVFVIKNGIILAEECSEGFYGLPTRCKKCPYPSHGAGCQSNCNCSKERCNHVTGCPVTVSENDDQATKHDNIEEKRFMTTLISKTNRSRGYESLVVNSSARTTSKQTSSNVSVITFVSIVLGGIGAILVFVHLIITVKPFCYQNETT